MAWHLAATALGVALGFCSHQTWAAASVSQTEAPKQTPHKAATRPELTMESHCLLPGTKKLFHPRRQATKTFTPTYPTRTPEDMRKK
jgi:hypothetical protein